MCRAVRLIGRSFKREWRRFADSRTYRMAGLWLPLVAFGFFVAFFSKGEVRDLPVAVVDEDNTPLSRRAVSMFDASSELAICYELQNTREAEQMLRGGEIYAVLLIPRNFQSDILALRGTSIELYNSGANLSSNGLISRGVMEVTRTLSAATTIRIVEQQGAPLGEALAAAEPIRLAQHALFNPWLNYGYYLAGCFMPMMLVVLCVVTTTYALSSELRDATAHEWIAQAEGSLGAALVGKLSFVTLLMSLVSAVMLGIVFFLQGVPLRGSALLVVIATLVLILSYEAVALFIVAMTANMRLALSLGGGYSVLAFTVSGITFPTMAMYGSVAWLSPLFPYTHYMHLMIDQTVRGAAVEYSLQYVAWMVIFWLLPIVAVGRLGRVFRDEKYLKRQ